MAERYRLEQMGDQAGDVQLRREAGPGGPAWVATIDPRAGFGCARLRIGDWEVLGVGGVRILFPWVGLVAPREARLSIGGREVAVGGGPAGGLATDGWKVDEVGEDARGTWVRARLHTELTSAGFGFPLVLEATWRLAEDGLRVDISVANRGRTHVPFGLGVRTDLAPVGSATQALAPAEEVWPLGPTGAPAGAPIAVSGALDLRRPRPIDGRVVGLLTRRQFALGRTQAAVIDPLTGREVWLNTSADFREVWIDLDARGAGVVESATCTPDAFALQAAGVHAGLRALAPGETWRGYALVSARLGRPTDATRWYEETGSRTRELA